MVKLIEKEKRFVEEAQSSSPAQEVKTKKSQPTELQREKARERKRNHRKRAPEANRLNDLRARVRRVCKKNFGYINDEWVRRECARRLQKSSGNVLSIPPGFPMDPSFNFNMRTLYPGTPSQSLVSPFPQSTCTPHEDFEEMPQDLQAAYALLELRLYPTTWNACKPNFGFDPTVSKPGDSRPFQAFNAETARFLIEPKPTGTPENLNRHAQFEDAEKLIPELLKLDTFKVIGGYR
ncbi:hypothetical protein L0F63_006595 [Massospora cicadina]|nr:hypothetical protein L0F63_006595 [Massospora cicadina]